MSTVSRCLGSPASAARRFLHLLYRRPARAAARYNQHCDSVHLLSVSLYLWGIDFEVVVFHVRPSCGREERGPCFSNVSMIVTCLMCVSKVIQSAEALTFWCHVLERTERRKCSTPDASTGHASSVVASRQLDVRMLPALMTYNVTDLVVTMTSGRLLNLLRTPQTCW